MNFIKIALIFTLILSLNSCYDEWLSVNPKTDIVKPLVFNDEQGIKDALVGAYIQLKSNDIYGENLSYSTLELILSSWDVTSSTTQQRLGLFNYTDAGVEGKINAIFAQEYKVIASVNSILDNIEKSRGNIKSEGVYELLKGECLALRAYCHFDLLRMFGPLPSSVSELPVLPYAKTLSLIPVSHISYSQFQTEIMNDLNEAENLLKDVDPITKYSLLDLGRPNSSSGTFYPADNFSAFRYFRMNYFAVKALQARANLWFNKPQEAYLAAKTVINAKNPDGNPKFRLGTSADMNAGDLGLTVEQIFSLYDFQFYTKYINNFVTPPKTEIFLYKKGSTETSIKSTLFGNTGTDIREINLWELFTQPNQLKTYILKKYKCAETASNHISDYKRIPLIRLSELYLIAAETAPVAEAQQFWADFRIARNISATTLPTDPVLAKAEIIKEYRKEFYAEGQTFFAYKRLNIQKPAFLFAPSAVTTANYVFPLPKTELINK